MKRWIGLAVTLAVAASLIVFPAGPASAAFTWTFTDNLESEGWWSDSSGAGSGFLSHTPTAHSGGTEAAVQSREDWGGFGRSIRMGVAGMEHRMACTVSLWVRPMAPVTRLNLEFIDPVTWDYIDLRTVTLDAPPEGFRPYEWVPPGWSWLMTKRDVYFRVSATATGSGWSDARFDDVTFTCSGGR